MLRRFLVLAFSLLLLASSTSARAASIDPDSTTLTVEPGASMRHVVTISNDSNRVQKFQIQLVEVTFGESAEDLRFTTLGDEKSEWVELGADSMSLNAGATGSVDLTISAPSDANADDSFALAVLATELPTEQSGVAVATGLASLIFANIDGGAAPDLHIEAFSTVPERARKFPIRFAALVQNVGSGLAEPDVRVEIRNWRGKIVETSSLNDLGRRVPANTHRIFSGEWTGRWWNVGPYGATLIVIPAPDAAPLTTSLNVVLFPWQLLVLLGAAILIVVVAVAVFVRAKRR